MERDRFGGKVRSLTRYENGESEPVKENLSKLAIALDFPEAFFAGPDIDQLPSDGASFRSLKSMTAWQRDSALAAGRLCIEFNKWIEERFKLPITALPSLRNFDPERLRPDDRSDTSVSRNCQTRSHKPVDGIIETAGISPETSSGDFLQREDEANASGSHYDYNAKDKEDHTPPKPPPDPNHREAVGYWCNRYQEVVAICEAQ